MSARPVFQSPDSFRGAHERRQLFQIGCVGSLSGEAGVFRFEGEADFGELDEALLSSGTSM
jgi:hypothetical protein